MRSYCLWIGQEAAAVALVTTAISMPVQQVGVVQMCWVSCLLPVQLTKQELHPQVESAEEQ